MFRCPLCGDRHAEKYTSDDDFHPWRCSICGEYSIDEQLVLKAERARELINHSSEADNAEAERLKDELGPLYGNVHLLSGMARLAAIEGAEPRRFGIDVAKEAARAAPKSILARIDRFLLSLGAMGEQRPQEPFIEDLTRALSFSRNQRDHQHLLMLMGQMSLVEYLATDPALPTRFHLTAHGWQKIGELREVGADSDQAFVAMRIHESTDSIHDAIREAIERNGYTALRLDEDIYTGLIDERMLVQIKRSRFMVAEVTDLNHGAYFEAGYAMGLGRPVFFTCREDRIEEQHFDIGHYVHIPWKEPADITDELDTRIRFWIGSLVPRDD
jgi:hypothetical protein